MILLLSRKEKNILGHSRSFLSFIWKHLRFRMLKGLKQQVEASWC